MLKFESLHFVCRSRFATATVRSVISASAELLFYRLQFRSFGVPFFQFPSFRFPFHTVGCMPYSRRLHRQEGLWFVLNAIHCTRDTGRESPLVLRSVGGLYRLISAFIYYRTRSLRFCERSLQMKNSEICSLF